MDNTNLNGSSQVLLHIGTSDRHPTTDYPKRTSQFTLHPTRHLCPSTSFHPITQEIPKPTRLTAMRHAPCKPQTCKPTARISIHGK